MRVTIVRDARGRSRGGRQRKARGQSPRTRRAGEIFRAPGPDMEECTKFAARPFIHVRGIARVARRPIQDRRRRLLRACKGNATERQASVATRRRFDWKHAGRFHAKNGQQQQKDRRGPKHANGASLLSRQSQPERTFCAAVTHATSLLT